METPGKTVTVRANITTELELALAQVREAYPASLHSVSVTFSTCEPDTATDLQWRVQAENTFAYGDTFSEAFLALRAKYQRQLEETVIVQKVLGSLDGLDEDKARSALRTAEGVIDARRYSK